MPKLSEKYIAGFTDADGSISVNWRPLDRANSQPELMRPYLCLSWTQETANDEVLCRIRDAIGGGKIYSSKDGKYSDLKITGAAAEMVLMRIKKHLVVKRHYADFVLATVRKVHNRKEMQARLKHERRVKSLPLPNFPSRKWLAGYFDGDGCFSLQTKSYGAVVAYATITADGCDTEGIEIIHKNFGGYLKPMYGKKHLMRWELMLPPSKAEQFFGYFAKHLVLKQDQAHFLMGCIAKTKHLRDGEGVKAVMSQLKARPHRLSEPKADIARLIATVQVIETDKDRFRQKFDENGGCLECGSAKHHCHGLCSGCYHRNLAKLKRQSEVATAT